MPTASSSRRRLAGRRHISSDIEEDTREEQAAPVAQNSRRDKGKGKAPQRAAEDRNADPGEGEGSDSDSDNNEVIDINNFKNQPLNKADLTKMKGYLSDWNNMASKIQQSWAIVGFTAAAMAETPAGREQDARLEELDKIMKNLIDIDAEMKMHSQFLDSTHQKVAQGVEINDVVDSYLKEIKSQKKAYEKKTLRQKYAKSEGYYKFHQGVYEVLHPETPMPPITEFLPKETGDISDDEDDLEVGGVTQNYNCPISLTPLVDPLTSSVCSHSFSAAALRQTFQTGPPVKKCPASGCNRSFRLTDCRPNELLARRVKAWQRRTQRTEDDSDAEEVVD